MISLYDLSDLIIYKIDSASNLICAKKDMSSSLVCATITFSRYNRQISYYVLSCKYHYKLIGGLSVT